MAAVLACGEGAVLSHLSAAALWGIRSQDPITIDVSVASRVKRSVECVRVHRPRLLGDIDVTVRAGIPVTSVPRTLIDSAEVVPRRTLERALDEAEYLRLLDSTGLARALKRHRGRAGAARLSAALSEHDPGTTRTQSELEERFLALVRRAGFPAPEVNARSAVTGSTSCGEPRGWRWKQMAAPLTTGPVPASATLAVARGSRRRVSRCSASPGHRWWDALARSRPR